MGADGSAYVVLGFEVTRTTFFVTKEAGIKCPNGHQPVNYLRLKAEALWLSFSGPNRKLL